MLIHGSSSLSLGLGFGHSEATPDLSYTARVGAVTPRTCRLSRSVWLITPPSPGAGEKMSKHATTAGDIAGLLMRFAQLQEKAQARTGQMSPVRHSGSGPDSPYAIDKPLTLALELVGKT